MEKFYISNPFTGNFDLVSRAGFDTSLESDCTVGRIHFSPREIRFSKDTIDKLQRYLRHDMELTERMVKDMHMKIQKVIFNPPATVVIWKDGSKTVVKCGENDIFDPEKGLAMAISKRAFGDNRDYYEIFAKWVGKYEYQQKKKEKK